MAVGDVPADVLAGDGVRPFRQLRREDARDEPLRDRRRAAFRLCRREAATAAASSVPIRASELRLVKR
jgi:hypothetical protein